MTAPSPVLFLWDGEAMRPAGPYWQRRADAEFVVGERSQLIRHEERSHNSHAHYFAALNDAWLSLPDHLAMQYPTAEHLRKHALIATGFRDERKIACSSIIEARKIAAFIKPMDEYALVIPRGDVVVVATAKSQSMKAMGKAVFQDSKQKVLDYVSALIGVEPEALSANAGRAA